MKDSRNTRNHIRILHTVSLLILLGVIICFAIKLEKNPELASPENVAKIVSSDPLIAAMEFVLLYVLKGISIVFPSTALNIASGMIFDFPFSILVSCLGISVEFSALYIFGRFFGKEDAEQFRDKYRVIGRIADCQSKNGFITSFIIRIIGLVSYDVGSIYLGASGIGYGSFMAGSMLGALLNIVIDNLFGRYVFNPFSWQLWAVAVIRIAIIITVAGIKKYAENHGSFNC